jgi:hypothetical protein
MACIAYVKWIDCTKHSGQFKTNDIPGMVTLETAGFLVSRNKRCVTLAMDRQKVDDEWRDIVEIPVVNIVELRICRSKAMRKERNLTRNRR